MFQGTSSESRFRKKPANEAIRLIDLRIANLRESIRVLNSQRNGLLPISKLPVEILTKIFLLHQKNATQGYAVQWLDWIGITHVSQRWREIALNFSGLWIHIPFYRPKWATEMIARSQHAYPIVKATYDPSRYPSEARLLKTFLQDHLSRIQVLEIQYTSHQLVGQLFQDIQPTSVPCLSMPWQEPGTEFSPADSLQILDTRFVDTNSLRKVEASTIPSWNLRLFSGLTYLKIGDGDGDLPRTQTSQREFLDALRRMPALQCLDLNGPALPEAVDRSSLEPVYLPDLQDLTVIDTVFAIEFFLHHVTFPPTTRIIIGCKHPVPVLQLANISPVLVPLKRLLSERPSALKLHHIKFSCFEGCEDWNIIDLRLSGWVSSSLEGYNPNFPSHRSDFTFFVEWGSQGDILPPEMDEFSVGMFGIFPQDDVVALSLSLLEITDPRFGAFVHNIGQLPALNALYLRCDFSARFFLELVRDVLQEGEDPSAVTYPALRYLDFIKCQIDLRVLMILYIRLKKRSELGLGPERLKVDLRGLELGRIDKKAAALLEKVVEVEWMMDDSDSDD